jgi:transposase-like protein
MQIPRRGILGKYSERPPECIFCNSASWWNGSREVCGVFLREGKVSYETEIVRRRARCSVKDCPQKSFTVYEEADSYPHRLFWLSVVVSAVSAVAFGNTTLSESARKHGCGRDSVRRWIRWVEKLAEPAELMRACTRLEPEGLPGAEQTARMPRAAAVIYLLQRLSELLGLRGVSLPCKDAGLISILKQQLERFGQVFYLTKSSPPLRADLSCVRL